MTIHEALALHPGARLQMTPYGSYIWKPRKGQSTVGTFRRMHDGMLIIHRDGNKRSWSWLPVYWEKVP